MVCLSIAHGGKYDEESNRFFRYLYAVDSRCVTRLFDGHVQTLTSRKSNGGGFREESNSLWKIPWPDGANNDGSFQR